jgi:hypothetical protein
MKLSALAIAASVSTALADFAIVQGTGYYWNNIAAILPGNEYNCDAFAKYGTMDYDDSDQGSNFHISAPTGASICNSGVYGLYFTRQSDGTYTFTRDTDGEMVGTCYGQSGSLTNCGQETAGIPGSQHGWTDDWWCSTYICS